MMTTIGIVFLCLSCLICLLNIVNNVSWVIKKRKDPQVNKRSNIHVLSVVFSIMAYSFAKNSLGLWAFIPAIIDPATIFIFLAPALLYHKLKKGGPRRDNT